MTTLSCLYQHTTSPYTCTVYINSSLLDASLTDIEQSCGLKVLFTMHRILHICFFTFLFNHSVVISPPPDINGQFENYEVFVQHIESLYRHCDRLFGSTDPLIIENTILRLEGKQFKQLSFNYYNSHISCISYRLVGLPLVS